MRPSAPTSARATPAAGQQRAHCGGADATDVRAADGVSNDTVQPVGGVTLRLRLISKYMTYVPILKYMSAHVRTTYVRSYAGPGTVRVRTLDVRTYGPSMLELGCCTY